MPFVQAKCPNCGGILAVNNENDAAICQFCNMPFVVEKAISIYNNTININSATINVSGLNTENLNRRALQYEEMGDKEKALEYYNQVLDIDIENTIALEGVDRITNGPKRIVIGKCAVLEEDYNDIIDLVKMNEKIKAINLVRKSSGEGLANAKETVEILYGKIGM